MKRGERRGRARAVAVATTILVCGPALHASTPALAAPGGVGPSFGTSGRVATPVRPASADFATALAVQADEQVVVAAGAGGDFGLARLNEYLYGGPCWARWTGRSPPTSAARTTWPELSA